MGWHPGLLLAKHALSHLAGHRRDKSRRPMEKLGWGRGNRESDFVRGESNRIGQKGIVIHLLNLLKSTEFKAFQSEPPHLTYGPPRPEMSYH